MCLHSDKIPCIRSCVQRACLRSITVYLYVHVCTNAHTMTCYVHTYIQGYIHVLPYVPEYKNTVTYYIPVYKDTLMYYVPVYKDILMYYVCLYKDTLTYHVLCVRVQGYTHAYIQKDIFVLCK